MIQPADENPELNCQQQQHSKQWHYQKQLTINYQLSNIITW